eukprot:TRINITY_DN35246_c0_g1_i1.p1 TRINITY_DN35246_c0_g1~~TRINITY_DN35246_c0_g1_i1.p1  ORF type:complete len:143 (+),score=45.19 TRINITY_DN35246_c0_g1_i1:114-542(+)
MCIRDRIKRVGSGLKDSDETWTDEERAAVENNLLDFFNLTGASISADATATKTMDMADINKPDGPQIRVSPSFSPPPQDMRTDAPTEGRLVSPLHDRRGSDQSATGSDAPFPRPVSYTHLRAHETPEHLVCRLLLEKKKKNN